jgi:DUF1680 family protein
MTFSRREFLRDVSAVGAASMMSSRGWASLKPVSEPLLEEEESRRQEPQTTLHYLTPVAINQVVIDDEFWSPKRKTWQEVTIRDCFRKFENDRGGALNNFDKVRDGQLGGHAGDPWMDGLIYEMIRGASDFMLSHPDPGLDRQLDGYISRIAAAAAKDPDGYVNTYTQLMEPGHRWGLNGGLPLWQHEVYNLGALVDAGVHHYRATGKTTLLVVGVKIANHMYDFMGPAPKKNIVPCHELPEEALVGLYELFREQPLLKTKVPLPVNEANYLSLAEFWIENRGNNIGEPDWEKNPRQAEQFVRRQEYGDGRPSWGAYAQDDMPVFDQQTIHGHAVRATLLCAGISAAARVNDNKAYRQTAVRLWESMVFRRMHITGGVGAYADQEKFGPDYTLPNDAYLETCAAVGAGFFHRNMNLAFGHARYADQLERTLYNGALSGVSLKGDTYFYQNPLEGDGGRARWIWHECPCCPPMFLKLMGAMPGYIYATDPDSVYVNLFVGSCANISVKNTQIIVRQTTHYPWDGSVRISVESAEALPFNFMLRIPEWCQGESITVNGQNGPTDKRVRGYVQINRTWKQGDVIELTLPMPVQPIRANPLVQADAGRVALTRGPLVYCLESADNGAQTASLAIQGGAKFTTEFRSDFLGGVNLIQGSALANSSPAWKDTLYRPAEDIGASKQLRITAIPYYANTNRGPVDMVVWLPLEAEA